MKKFSRELMGSVLNITIYDNDIDLEVIENCFFETEKFEKKYSRFLEDSYLSLLNKNKSSQEIPGELLSILKLSNKVSQISNGYFDITILPFLENIGYGINKEEMKEVYGYKNIVINDNTIKLENGVSIDIGSVGKGYIVDKIYNILNEKYNDFVIDFGGDIRIKGKQKIYLEDPLQLSKNIGYIELENNSIASSASNRRKTKKGGHLINPKKNITDDKLAVYTIHKLASFSDILSTALYVSPIEVALDMVKKSKGLEAMIIMKNGKIYKTNGFNIKNI